MSGSNVPAGTRNFTFADYLAMCRAGDAKFSIKEAADLLGVTRQSLYRAMELAGYPEDIFEATLAHMKTNGKPMTTTGMVEALRKRTGRARESVERCPHCGGVLGRRQR